MGFGALPGFAVGGAEPLCSAPTCPVGQLFKICRFSCRTAGCHFERLPLAPVIRLLAPLASSFPSLAALRSSLCVACSSRLSPHQTNTPNWIIQFGVLCFFGISRLFHFTTQTPSAPQRVRHSRHGRLHRERNTDIRLST